MSGRVSRIALAVLVLSLSFNTQSLSAATRDDAISRGSVIRNIVRVLKKIAKPFIPASYEDDTIDVPNPPRP